MMGNLLFENATPVGQSCMEHCHGQGKLCLIFALGPNRWQVKMVPPWQRLLPGAAVENTVHAHSGHVGSAVCDPAPSLFSHLTGPLGMWLSIQLLVGALVPAECPKR